MVQGEPESASTKAASRRPAEAPITLPARLTLFGHDAVETQIVLIPRSPGWRAVRTGKTLALFAVITPVVGVVPPHAPWIVGALTAAAVFSRRRWTERFSVANFNAPCPRCGNALTLRQGVRFRAPYPVPCDGCGHEPLLAATLPA